MTEIPIANIYYLLCYAWRHVEESEIVAASELNELRHVQDLLGCVLAAGVRRLVRRGIDRGYREVREDVAGVRGKVMIGETVKRALLTRGQTACVTEELSHDVVHNRLLKSTLRGLLRARDLRGDVRSQVRGAYRALSGVSELRLTSRAFRRVQLDRNRRLYRFLLGVCRLVHESLLVGEAEGPGEFFDFRRDDQQMWRIFEEFVIEFLRREQSVFSINRTGRKIPWHGAEGAPADLARVPKMLADVILESSERRIILDAKYYRQSVSPSGTLHSANLYQLLAYLRNRQARYPEGPAHEGILLYPTIAEPLRVDIRLDDFRLQVRTVDLARPWRQIHREILEVVGLV